MPQKQQIEKVGVYRQHQPLYKSPCILGNPCGICRAHQLNKKTNTPCMFATPAESAFTIPIKSALALVTDKLAVFAHGGTAIQLTFSKLAQLRDVSLKIDERMLMAYAEGRRFARAAVDGWEGIRYESSTASRYAEGNVKQVSVSSWTPEMMAQSRERIQSFV